MDFYASLLQIQRREIIQNFLRFTAIVFATLAATAGHAAETPTNYDEAKVPRYTLPDPLVLVSGQRVTDAATWRNVRRPEIKALFEKNVYGVAPAKPASMTYDLRSTADAFGGKAVRKEVRIWFTDNKSGPKIDLLVFVPKQAKGPSPAFVGLNFSGNQEVLGQEAGRWQVEKIIGRGYGLVTACYKDIVPDDFAGWKAVVQTPLFAPKKSGDVPPGAIALWAWGLSRAMDYIETDKDIDSKHVAVMGHSRLGKTALWAGASDERFALVISNCSGCGGASLARRRVGETVQRITKAFPHWFVPTYAKYADHLDDLPVDQHMLIALIAPRPVHITSAEGDRWADPHGEFLSGLNADPVYRLLGTDGLAVREMPPIERPVMSTIGYHIRHGKHDVTEYDWQCYLDFADRYFTK